MAAINHNNSGLPVRTWSRNGYEISTERARIDIRFTHRELSKTYWAKNITRQQASQCFNNSLAVFGVYRADGVQVGCARLVSDGVRFAYLMDVIITKSERGKGLGAWLNKCVINHPDLKSVRTWLLSSRDAREFYQKIGWTPLKNPERLLTRKL